MEVAGNLDKGPPSRGGHPAGGRPPTDSYTHWLKHKGNSFRRKCLQNCFLPAFLHHVKPKPHEPGLTCPVSFVQRLQSLLLTERCVPGTHCSCRGEGREAGSKAEMAPPQSTLLPTSRHSSHCASRHMDIEKEAPAPPPRHSQRQVQLRKHNSLHPSRL